MSGLVMVHCLHANIISILDNSVYRSMEVSLFRVDEFVKFDEFDENLPIHIKGLDRWKILLIPTYDYCTTGKSYISHALSV